MVIGALKDKQDTVGYNANFFYPKEGGIQAWILKLAQAIKKPIRTGYTVEKIDLKKRILYFDNGSQEEFSTIVSTMPLDNLIKCVKEKPSSRLKKALANLKCNSVVNFNLGINRPNLTDKHWIYFPEKEYPFYRIGFGHNFSPKMAPKGCSSLYGEFSHMGKSQDELKHTLKASLDHTKKILNISDDEIVTQKTMYISHAYVIYNFWREKYLPRLHKQLQENNIYSVGRYGEWKYASMQEAVLDGKKVAETITIMPAKTAYYQESPVISEKQKEAH